MIRSDNEGELKGDSHCLFGLDVQQIIGAEAIHQAQLKPGDDEK